MTHDWVISVHHNQTLIWFYIYHARNCSVSNKKYTALVLPQTTALINNFFPNTMGISFTHLSYLAYGPELFLCKQFLDLSERKTIFQLISFQASYIVDWLDDDLSYPYILKDTWWLRILFLCRVCEILTFLVW